jgi:hypothetical protein
MIMSDRRYYVVGDHDVWMIKFNDDDHSRWANCEEAVILAINAAQKLGARGECAHVCVVDHEGQFRAKWTYNRDQRLCGGASPHRPTRSVLAEEGT